MHAAIGLTSFLEFKERAGEVIIFYDIAEYRDGSYVEANEKFNKARDRLNDLNK